MPTQPTQMRTPAPRTASIPALRTAPLRHAPLGHPRPESRIFPTMAVALICVFLAACLGRRTELPPAPQADFQSLEVVLRAESERCSAHCNFILPPGVFHAATVLELPPNSSLEGQDPLSTRIEFAGDGPALKLGCGASRLQGVSLIRTGVAWGSTGVAVSCPTSGTAHVAIRDVSIAGFGTAILVGTGHTQLFVENSTLSDNTVGLLEPPGGTGGRQIVAASISAPKGDDLDLSGGNWAIYGTSLTAGDGHAIRGGGFALSCFACDVAAGDSVAVQIDAPATTLLFIGGSISGNETDGGGITVNGEAESLALIGVRLPARTGATPVRFAATDAQSSFSIDGRRVPSAQAPSDTPTGRCPAHPPAVQDAPTTAPPPQGRATGPRRPGPTPIDIRTGTPSTPIRDQTFARPQIGLRIFDASPMTTSPRAQADSHAAPMIEMTCEETGTANCVPGYFAVDAATPRATESNEVALISACGLARSDNHAGCWAANEVASAANPAHNQVVIGNEVNLFNDTGIDSGGVLGGGLYTHGPYIGFASTSSGPAPPTAAYIADNSAPRNAWHVGLYVENALDAGLLCGIPGGPPKQEWACLRASAMGTASPRKNYPSLPIEFDANTWLGTVSGGRSASLQLVTDPGASPATRLQVSFDGLPRLWIGSDGSINQPEPLPSIAGGTALTWNASAGEGETDIWNIYPTPNTNRTAFSFRTFDDTGAVRAVASLDRRGDLKLPGSLRAANSPLVITTPPIGGFEVAPGSCALTRVHVPGAASGTVPSAAPVRSPGPAITWSARIAAPDTVEVRLCNVGTHPAPTEPTNYVIAVVR